MGVVGGGGGWGWGAVWPCCRALHHVRRGCTCNQSLAQAREKELKEDRLRREREAKDAEERAILERAKVRCGVVWWRQVCV